VDFSRLTGDPVAVLARHGKTFRWAGRFLSAARLQRAARLYRILRFLDDVADEDIGSAGAGPALLHWVYDTLQTGKDTGELPAPLREELQYLLSELAVDPAVLAALVAGLLQDIDGVQLATQEELLRYSYRVAGTVGLMMCAVFDVRDPAAAAFAIDLGIAMQLTNICRDVKEDAERGRRYLPLAVAAEVLQAPGSVEDAAVRGALADTLALAERYYQSGLSGLGYLPWQARWTIACAAVLYRAIGRKLQRRRLDWQRGRVFLGSGEKTLTVLLQLPWLLVSLLRAPAAEHEAALHVGLRCLPHVAS
jgi:phytoene synthase